MNSTPPPRSPRDDEPDRQPITDPTLLDTLKSVLWGLFGVQSARNRERDFSRGKPMHYVVIGLLVTLLFILGVSLVVKLILRSAGL